MPDFVGEPEGTSQATAPSLLDELADPADLPLKAIIDLEALRFNLKLIRKFAGRQEIIACVKANAYGHGLKAVAECLQAQGVRWLSVGSPAEALSLRRWGIGCRILLFPTVCKYPGALIAESGITIGIQSYEEAESLARAATGPVSIFLKVDTGLARFGVSTGNALALVTRIQKAFPSLHLEGIFTHLPFAGGAPLPWIELRMKEFGKSISEIRDCIGRPLLVQAFASAGIAFGLKMDEANAVSPGELLFGIERATGDQKRSFGTRPVLQQITTVLGLIRRVSSGTRFGFGGNFVASRDTLLGLLPTGFSNSVLMAKQGQVASLLGHRAPILMVGLEHAAVDVTDIPGVDVGCPVALLERDSVFEVSLDHMAQVQQRSTLEVVTSLPAHAVYEYI